LRRRTFLQTSALAAGAALLEACGSEEIVYIESPVARRRGLKGVGIWHTSSCGQCPSGCGTRVRVVDGNAKKVEGIEGHPINHGGLCALGQASLQGLYNPDRITTPLRATGERGSGAFEEIGWDEALEIAAEALARAAATDPGSAGDPGRVGLLGGDGGGLLEPLLKLFSEALGVTAPSYLRSPDQEVERRAAQIALGTTGMPAYDLENADYVLSIGPAFLDRWRSPVYGIWALSQIRGGRRGRRGKLVQAESRMSQTAATADEWLPVRPGSEGVLARAIAGVLLRENLAAGSVEAYRRLFPEPAPDPESAAETCGLRAKQIVRIARELASVEQAVVLGGGSAALHGNGLFNTTAALGLNLLLGSLGRAGGVFEAADFGLAERLSTVEETSLSELTARLAGVETLLILEADPLHNLPGALGWREALAEVDTVIAMSAFWDDTTRQADLVLPVQVDVERFQAGEAPHSVRPVFNLASPVVAAEGDSRHPGDVLLALATALEKTETLPWSRFSDMVEALVREAVDDLPGGSGAPFRGFFENAQDQGGLWANDRTGATPPGPAAAFDGSAEAKSGGAEPTDEFVLTLYESAKFGDGRGANRPWLQELPDTLSTVMWASWGEIATPDAEALGVATGDLLEVSSDFGSVEVAAIVSPAVRPGTLAIPLGLGHDDFGRYAKGRGVNPLDLLGPGTVDGTGVPNLGGTRVRLKRTGRARVALFGRGLRDLEDIPTGWASHEVTPAEPEDKT